MERRTVFGSALVAVSIAGVRGAEGVVARAADSIESQMLRFGIWKYSPDYGGGFPPDLDDTAMASLALRLTGRAVPDNTHAFLANRNRDGLFFTWLSPRLRWLRDPRMGLIAAARWRHPFVHYRAFRVAGAREHDLDAVVNANVLYYLGRTAATEPVIPFLLRVLRECAEVGCAKWYDSRLAIWYFLSRALRHAGADARSLLLERLRSEPVQTPLEHAFAACVLLDCDAPADAHIAAIVATQLDSGGSPRAIVYGDGRVPRKERQVDGQRDEVRSVRQRRREEDRGGEVSLVVLVQHDERARLRGHDARAHAPAVRPQRHQQRVERERRDRPEAPQPPQHGRQRQQLQRKRDPNRDARRRGDAAPDHERTGVRTQVGVAVAQLMPEDVAHAAGECPHRDGGEPHGVARSRGQQHRRHGGKEMRTGRVAQHARESACLEAERRERVQRERDPAAGIRGNEQRVVPPEVRHAGARASPPSSCSAAPASAPCARCASAADAWWRWRACRSSRAAPSPRSSSTPRRSRGWCRCCGCASRPSARGRTTNFGTLFRLRETIYLGVILAPAAAIAAAARPAPADP